MTTEPDPWGPTPAPTSPEEYARVMGVFDAIGAEYDRQERNRLRRIAKRDRAYVASK